MKRKTKTKPRRVDKYAGGSRHIVRIARAGAYEIIIYEGGRKAFEHAVDSARTCRGTVAMNVFCDGVAYGWRRIQ